MKNVRVSLISAGLAASGLAALALVFGLAERHTVVGVWLSSVSVVIAVNGWIRQRAGQPGDAAETLARELRNVEAEALEHVLGDSIDPRLAEVWFRLRDDLAPRSAEEASRGTVDAAASYYRGLRHGRLVVVGEAGAGKSVMLLKIATDLLAGEPGSWAAGKVVPVRMNLASFEPNLGGRQLAEVGSAELAARLESWMASRLVRLGVGRAVATRLVTERRVLPLLDGLDEARDVDRAAAVLRALNVAAANRPFVLTCRTATVLRPEVRRWLPDASVVELEPVSPRAIRAYIVGRMGRLAAGSRWRRALEAVDQLRAGFRDRDDSFAAALGSPWRLYLCVTAYADRGDPYRDLAGLTSGEIRRVLLAKLIPALVAQDAPRRGQRYPASDVEQYLRSAARWSEPLSSGSAEIALPAIWPVAGRRLPRFVGGLAQAALGWGAGAVAFCAEYPEMFRMSMSPRQGVAFAVCCVLLVLATALMNTGLPVMVSQLSLHQWRTPRARRNLLTLVLPSVVLGSTLLAGVIGVVLSWRSALPVGLAGGAVVFLQMSFARRPTAIARPSQVIRRSVNYDVLAGLTGGVAFGVAAGASGVPGLPAGLLFAFLLARPTWFRYAVAILLGRRHNRLPWRPGRFFDWAYDVGLIRLADGGVEFRHAEFRAWLLEADTGAAEQSRRRATAIVHPG